jgi:ribosomal protein S27E
VTDACAGNTRKRRVIRMCEVVIGKPNFTVEIGASVYGCYDESVLSTDTAVSCMDCGDNMTRFVALEYLKGEIEKDPSTAIICVSCATLYAESDA